jgi:hypothetical protein
MKLGVSYNVFDGVELLEYAIKSIRNCVDHVNVVYQVISNWGNPESFCIKDIVYDLKNKNLIDEVTLYNPKSAGKNNGHFNEVAKRNFGLNICKNVNCTHFMSLDVDEFFIEKQLVDIKNIIENEKIDSSSCKIVNYIKNPTWRFKYMDPTHLPLIWKIYPDSKYVIEGALPCCKDPTRSFLNVGKYKFFDRDIIEMHHMDRVRKDLGLKYINSSAQNLADVARKVREVEEKGLDNDIILVDNIFGINI